MLTAGFEERPLCVEYVDESKEAFAVAVFRALVGTLGLWKNVSLKGTGVPIRGEGVRVGGDQSSFHFESPGASERSCSARFGARRSASSLISFE